MSKGFGTGGAREGAGRKPKYLTDDETNNIRVPAKHKEAFKKISEVVDELIDNGFTPDQILELLRKAENK